MAMHFADKQADLYMPPPGLTKIRTCIYNYGSSVICLAYNNVLCQSSSPIESGINHFYDGIVVVCGLPLLKKCYAQPLTVYEAINSLKSADGVFAAVGYNLTTGNISVITDFMGLMPLYAYRMRGNLSISTTTTGVNPDPDFAGWGALLSMGHTIGTHSLVHGVKRLRGGMTYYFDSFGRSTGTESYWELPLGGPKPKTNEIVEALSDNAKDYLGVLNANKTSILLSGGFDSRLILCILFNIGVNIDALIISHRNEKGNMDGYISKKCAKLLKIATQECVPKCNFFSTSDYLKFFVLTDACFPSLYLFISQLENFLQQNNGCWEGLIPGYSLAGPHVPKDATFNSLINQECFGFRSIENWCSARKIFKKDYFDMMFKSFHELLNKELKQYPETHSGLWHFVLENRMRHRTAITSTKAFSVNNQPLLLGSSKNVWTLAGSMTPEQRRNHAFYKSIFRHEFPVATKVPFISGGALDNAYACYFEKFCYDVFCRGNTWLQHRPRIIRFLGLLPTAFEHSKFLEHPALFEPEDYDGLNWEAIRHHATNGTLTDSDRRLLFQWQGWRWVQQGCLEAKLIDP